MNTHFNPTGPANSYRVKNSFGEWKVQGTDNNCVWVSADQGAEYATREEAVAAAQEWAERTEGTFIGVLE